MDTYNKISYKLSRALTLDYSTSFGMSSRLFSRAIRPHIYAIYGLVRIADEIVDTYAGSDQKEILNALETEVYAAMARGYSPNPIVHSFALTANEFGITKKITAPFFKSMRLDLKPAVYDQAAYETYIYGSAEVVGLMCLKVFCAGDSLQYTSLETSAQALGSAYQKINFLRDISADYHVLQRFYFPNTSFEAFSEAAKKRIVSDIERDISVAQADLDRLPSGAYKAVATSLVYYKKLLDKIKQTPASTLKTTRIRIPNAQKVVLLSRSLFSRGNKS